MSVNTTADEAIHQAKEDIASAIRHLGELVINECWGADQFGEEYLDKLNEVLQVLIECRGKMR